MFIPPMHKRIAFAHEREIRMVTIRHDLQQMAPEEVPPTISIPWDCDALVEQVYVDPYAPEYFFDAVRTVIRSIAPSLEDRLTWSFMKASPIF